MPKYALRTATALALLAMIAVIAISLLTTGASDATAFNADARAVPAAPAPPAPPAPPTIPAQYADQCSNGTAVPNPASNAGLVADCAALLASKDTLEGRNGNLNWAANLAVSDWDGVTIANNRVSKLEIDDQGLNGTIPAELGNLANLDRLYLGYNDLSGAIPPELGNLANLTMLVLNWNRLTGAIPAELGNLANLDQLHISYNDLSGEIPAELGNLSNLRKLILSGNQLTGEIPAELDNLANLWTLHLNDNRLTGEIPSQLGNLANLVDLRLNSNQLTGEIPAELGNLSNLGALNLASNSLTGEIPAELGNLSNLGALNLASNNLTGCVPRSLAAAASAAAREQARGFVLPICAAPTTPTPTPTPTATWVPGATATSTPTRAARCSNGIAVPNPAGNAGLVSDCVALLASRDTLQGRSGNLNWAENLAISDWHGVTVANNRVSRLQAQGLGLNGTIPAELGNLANLTVLDLNGFTTNLGPNRNRLTGEIPSELGNLAKLTGLWLGYNDLSGEIPAELGNLANLSTLDLYGNQLTGEIPAELGNLAKLADLRLYRNQLTGEIPEELGNLANLTFLFLRRNQLTGEIPSELGNLANLTHLFLNDNRLTGEIPAELGNLAKIEDLRLNNNNLTSEIPAELGNLANLNRLYLHGNQLTGCIPRSLIGRSSLPDSLGLPFCAAATTPTPTVTPTPTATSVPGATPTPTASQLAAQCSNGATVPNPDRSAGLVADCIALLTSKPILEGDTRSPLNWSANRAISDWYGVTTANNRVTRLSMDGADDDEAALNGVIPAQLGSLAKLEYLRLSFFGLTGAIPAELGNLANLKSLFLEDNLLTGDVPAELGNLSNLATLVLRYNDLTGCVPQSLRAAAAGASAREQESGFVLPFCAAPTAAMPTPTATTAPRLQRPTITPTPTATPAIVIETTPTPTATPASGASPVATPTPTATPAIVIEPTPTATPTSVVTATDDPCVERLSGSGSANGSWADGCLSANPPNDENYYARFYTFTLDAASDVTITLSSDDGAPYLYLLDGAGTGGSIERETGASNASAAAITQTLQPGDYTIEATTYYAETGGDFTLEFEATPTPDAPADACVDTLAGSGSASGGWTSACLSVNPPPNGRDYYARFYTFTLSTAAQVTITLSSADAAPYLYLLDGAGTGGAINRQTGAANASSAAISASLQPGAYTIEATTYYSETAGDFTLELEIAR